MRRRHARTCLAAVVCATTLALAGCAGETTASPAGGATASPAAGESAAAPADSATPPGTGRPATGGTGQPAAGDCRAEDLSAALGAPEAGMVSDVAVGSVKVRLTNRSAADCYVTGGITGRLEGPATGQWASSLDLPLDGEAGEVRIPPGRAAEAVLVYRAGTNAEQPWHPAQLVVAVPGDPEPIVIRWPDGEGVLQGPAAVIGDLAVNRFQPLTAVTG